MLLEPTSASITLQPACRPLPGNDSRLLISRQSHLQPGTPADPLAARQLRTTFDACPRWIGGRALSLLDLARYYHKKLLQKQFFNNKRYIKCIFCDNSCHVL